MPFHLGRFSPRGVLNAVKKAASSVAQGTKKAVSSVARGAKKAASSVARGAKTVARGTRKAASSVVRGTKKVAQQVRKVRGATARVVRSVAHKGAAVASRVRRTVQRVKSSPTVRAIQRKVATAKRVLQAGKALKGAAQLPGQVRTAARDIRRAVVTRTKKDLDKAIGSSRQVLSSAKDVAEGGPEVRKFAVKGAREARRSARTLGRKVVRVGSNGAQAVRRNARQVGSKAADLGAEVGSKAAVRAGERVGGKALGRFVPGANIAIAGLDSAAFVSTLQDKKASTGKKVLAGVRAAGSITAATDIPFAGQAGAIIASGADVAINFKVPRFLSKVHF